MAMGKVCPKAFNGVSPYLLLVAATSDHVSLWCGSTPLDHELGEGHQFTDRTAELALFGTVEHHLPCPSACATSSCAGSSAC